MNLHQEVRFERVVIDFLSEILLMDIFLETKLGTRSYHMKTVFIGCHFLRSFCLILLISSAQCSSVIFQVNNVSDSAADATRCSNISASVYTVMQSKQSNCNLRSAWSACLSYADQKGADSKCTILLPADSTINFGEYIWRIIL
jgi:hypothetical protein